MFIDGIYVKLINVVSFKQTQSGKVQPACSLSVLTGDMKFAQHLINLNFAY